MGHLLVGQVKLMESIFHAGDLREFVGMSDTEAPRCAESMIDSFELPQEIIDFLKHDHHFVRKDG